MVHYEDLVDFLKTRTIIEKIEKIDQVKKKIICVLVFFVCLIFFKPTVKH